MLQTQFESEYVFDLKLGQLLKGWSCLLSRGHSAYEQRGENLQYWVTNVHTIITPNMEVKSKFIIHIYDYYYDYLYDYYQIKIIFVNLN